MDDTNLPVDTQQDLTVQDVKKAVPTKLKSAVTQEFVDKINQSINDPLMAQSIKENFLTYTHVLLDGRYQLYEYLNAVKYVSFKLMGMTNQDAYFKTFPDRYAKLVAQGTSAKDISCYVSAFHKTKLVTSLIEQSLIPIWLLNQDVYQKAINTQVELMNTAKSERIRCMAADSLLNHLKKPEKTEAAVNIDMRETKGISELKEALITLAKNQKMLIEKQGVSPKIIAEQEIVDVESD